MSTKHTPGPWRINSVETYQDAEDCYFATIIGPDLKCLASMEVDEIETDGPTTRANASLIVAAPDLLGANRLTLRNLESMILQLPLNADPNERKSLQAWIDIVRAAIAKATAPETPIT